MDDRTSDICLININNRCGQLQRYIKNPLIYERISRSVFTV